MRKSLFRATCRWTNNTDQAGQAVVEYILLLVVGIALILGLSTKFFKPAQKWANVYMGSYTQCLLDSGALPSMAGGHPEGCTEASFDGSGVGGSSSASSNKDGSSSADGSGNGKDGKSSSSSGSSGKGSHHNGHASARRGGSHTIQGAGMDLSNLKDNNSKTGTEGPAGTGNKSHSRTNQDGFRSSSSSVVDSVQGRGRHIRSIGVSGVLPPETVTASVEERAARQQKDDDDRMKPKRTLIKPPERNAASIRGDNDEGFSFGSLFRIGIIIMIIVGILYILSTQLNSVFKSMDK